MAKKRIAAAVVGLEESEALRFVSSWRIALDDNAVGGGPETLWRICSMIMLITGAAAMLLVEERKFTLDTPVGEFSCSLEFALRSWNRPIFSGA